MSELIHGRQARQEILKEIIKDLHRGVPVEEVKGRFKALIADVGPREIGEMEQQLIAEGLPEEEIKKLCDVHVQIFEDALEQQEKPQVTSGHPVDTLRRENEAIARVVEELTAQLSDLGDPPSEEKLAALKESIQANLEKLGEVEKHYLKKENQLFPVLEKHGVGGPSKVMWALHDDIRALLKEVQEALRQDDPRRLVYGGKRLLNMVDEMIYKEENILFPMTVEMFTEEDWAHVHRGEEEIGYALIEPGGQWQPVKAKGPVAQGSGVIELDTGVLTPEQINLLLTHLPVDVTYVDEHDRVRYYSQGKERIFPRSSGIIGRDVQNCHPPNSVHVVTKIVDSFKTGERDDAEFWIQMQGRFIHIRYFAVRDKDGEYRGVVEVSQDVTGIRALEGQRRLLDW
ncbi:MAG: DUF438 domain-containing protein [Limnochordia bacterium]|jgi:DUF438 domain-containing protein